MHKLSSLLTVPRCSYLLMLQRYRREDRGFKNRGSADSATRRGASATAFVTGSFFFLSPLATQRTRRSTAMPLEDLTKRANFSKYDESVVKDMPEHPGLALTSHVLLKCIQVWMRVHSTRISCLHRRSCTVYYAAIQYPEAASRCCPRLNNIGTPFVYFCLSCAVCTYPPSCEPCLELALFSSLHDPVLRSSSDPNA